MAEKEAAAQLDGEEEAEEDPNANLGTLEELEGVLHISPDDHMMIPISAQRLPCAAHKVQLIFLKL